MWVAGQTWSAFALALAGCLVVALSQGAKPFPYDSYSYWHLGKAFDHNGHWSLLNFSSPLRGYLLPLIYGGLANIAAAVGLGGSSIVEIFNAVLFALIGAVLAPLLAENIWPRHRWGTGRRLLLTAVLLVYWRGYLAFPLSDFPALALLLLATLALARTSSPIWALIAGIAVSAAINVRPSYLPLAAALVVLPAWELSKPAGPRTSWRRSLLSATVLGLGFSPLRCRSRWRLTVIITTGAFCLVQRPGLRVCS